MNCANTTSKYCCTKPCNDDLDCINQECDIANNKCRLDSWSSNWSKCSLTSICSLGDGDCDVDSECEGALVCGEDNCESGPAGMDCCEIYRGEKFPRLKLFIQSNIRIYSRMWRHYYGNKRLIWHPKLSIGLSQQFGLWVVNQVLFKKSSAIFVNYKKTFDFSQSNSTVQIKINFVKFDMEEGWCVEMKTVFTSWW